MISRSNTYFNSVGLLLIATSAGLIGCGGTGGGASGGAEGFVSDDPNGSFSGGNEDGGPSGTTGGAGDPMPPPTAGDDAERAIEEADIIQVKDNRLYALSQYSGLSIIDISAQNQLTLVGRYQASGVPFEMYLKDNVVYAMFSSWGQYIYDEAEESYKWVQSSRVEALDVSNPASIEALGAFDIPGSISDSRVVGDVLYTVTYENGYCWSCQSTPNTTITSLKIGDPASISVVDQLSYADNDPYGYGWRRSVSVTPERMYVAGVEWDGALEGHSTIQVVDISDPTGQLVKGASVEAKGQIESRWQMDEHEGVLRVISQPGIWWSNSMPAVQTFTVASSQSVLPLGYTELQLPKPETLRSVRFDGSRAYAITAEQTDPLFTVDLSNPAQPKQMGELEIPGWIYHMEPRGDRLLALGFENGNPEGSLHVSLFDVADMTNPTMIKRVYFGGQWSSVGEDQDRIHKSFKVLDDLGLILVPYSGYVEDAGGQGCGSYVSGVQLVDFTASSLQKRGVASSRGQARRALIHNERMLTVSDEEVRSFNIQDRDAPAKTASLPIAMNVNHSVIVGDLLVRISADWWSEQPKLEVVPLATPDQMEPVGVLDLAELTQAGGGGGDFDQGCYGMGLYNAKIFANGQHIYIVYPGQDWVSTRIAVIDVTDATSPAVVGKLSVPSSFYWYGGYGMVMYSGEPVVQSGSTLVLHNIGDSNGMGSIVEASLEVVDLSNPANPHVAATVALPDGLGHTPLHIEGSTVLTSHWAPLPNDPSKVKFYLDRVNIADPSSPVLAPSVNVPGSLAAWDNPSSRALTVDYKKTKVNVLSGQVCWQSYGVSSWFEPLFPNNYDGPGACVTVHRTFKLVDVGANSAALLDSFPLEDGYSLSNLFIGDDRVFATVHGDSYYVEDGNGPNWDAYKIMTLSGMRDGAIDVAYVSGKSVSDVFPVSVEGQRLITASWNAPGISVLDAADLDALELVKKGDLRGFVSHVEVAGDVAVCSLGRLGVEVVELD